MDDSAREPPCKKPRLETADHAEEVARIARTSTDRRDPPDASKYNFWTKEEVLEFFTQRGVEGDRETLEKLLRKMMNCGSYGQQFEVEGKNLDRLALQTADYYICESMNGGEDGLPDDSVEKKIRKILDHVKSLQQQLHVTFNDPIHGSIKLHPLLVKIVDTSEFQRLRHIQQLGPSCYVYPGATHTRFAHSIGTCYIAGELGRTLQTNQPELEITEKDILCIQIAGLCHDLGHGPFSHMFEEVAEEILQECRSQGDARVMEKWTHELISCKVFDAIYKKRESDFQHYGLEPRDIDFVREQLEGRDTISGRNLRGRPNKKFLYEVVANKRNGIDVDKWDYFARDCHYLGIPNDFNWRRCMSVALIAAPKDDPSDLQICLRDKEVLNIYNMFHTRTNLHQHAYKHKTTRVVHHMFKEVLWLAKDAYILHDSYDHDAWQQRSWSLKEAVLKAASTENPDISGFLLLTDDFTGQVLIAKYLDCSPDNQLIKDMRKAKELLRKVQERNIYHLVGSVKVPAEKAAELQSSSSQKLAEEMYPPESVDRFFIDVVTFSFGSEVKRVAGVQAPQDAADENPLKEVRFCTKQAPWNAVLVDHNQISQMRIPRQFVETVVRVYCKEGDRRKHLKPFQKWVKGKFGPEVEVLAPYASAQKAQRGEELLAGTTHSSGERD